MARMNEMETNQAVGWPESNSICGQAQRAALQSFSDITLSG
jgi:hypothetical protein